VFDFLKNKTFYAIVLDITAGEDEDRVRFRHVFYPSGKPEDSRSCVAKGSQ
jgi:hypothetical protein